MLFLISIGACSIFHALFLALTLQYALSVCKNDPAVIVCFVASLSTVAGPAIRILLQ